MLTWLCLKHDNIALKFAAFIY